MSAVKEQTNDRDRSGAHRVVQGLGSSAERPQEDEERDVERGSIAKTGEDRPPTHAKVEQRVNQEELGLVGQVPLSQRLPRIERMRRSMRSQGCCQARFLVVISSARPEGSLSADRPPRSVSPSSGETSRRTSMRFRVDGRLVSAHPRSGSCVRAVGGV